MYCDQWPLSFWDNLQWPQGEWPYCDIVGSNFGCEISISTDLISYKAIDIDFNQVLTQDTNLIQNTIENIDLSSYGAIDIDLIQNSPEIINLISNLVGDINLVQNSNISIDLVGVPQGGGSESEVEDEVFIAYPTDLNSYISIPIDLISSPILNVDLRSVYNINVELCEQEGDCGCQAN